MENSLPLNSQQNPIFQCSSLEQSHDANGGARDDYAYFDSLAVHIAHEEENIENLVATDSDESSDDPALTLSRAALRTSQTLTSIDSRVSEVEGVNNDDDDEEMLQHSPFQSLPEIVFTFYTFHFRFKYR